MKKTLTIMLSLFFVWSFSSCIDSEKAAEKLTEKIIENATGEEVDLEINEDGEASKMTIKGQDGEEITISNNEKEIPAEFPKDLFVPKGEIETSGAISGADGLMITLTMIAEGTFDEVKTKIKEELKSAGWESTSDMGVDDSIMMNFGKDGSSATITVNSEDGVVDVGYIVNVVKEK